MRRLAPIDLRPAERRPTLLMVASILTIVASYVMVKAVRDAVFLSRFGPTELAFVFLLVAAFTGLASAIGTRLGRGAAPHRLVLGVNVVVAASLLLLWLALRRGVAGTAWVLYLWSSFFGLFMLANFWLLGNRLYDARAAKRAFPVLAAGATLGGIVGGWATALARVVGAVDLLPIIAALVLLSAALAAGAWRLRPPGTAAVVAVEAAAARPRRDLGTVASNRYLRLLAALLLLATVAATIVEVQLKAAAKAHFASDTDAMAAFFGVLTMVFSAVALAIQLLATGPILRRFGVRRALLILPAAMAAGAAAILLHPAVAIPLLGAAALAKTLDAGLRFSVDKAALELLYVPVPAAVKAKAKPIIDTVADRLGTAASAVLWLLLTAALGEGTRSLVPAASLLVLALLAGWVVVILRVRAEYVQAFRVALPGPAADPHAIPVDLRDPRQRRALRGALASPDDRAVVLALETLATAGRGALLPEVPALARHPAPQVRARAFDALAATGDGRAILDAARAAADPQPDVRAAAMRYLGAAAPRVVLELAAHPDVRTRLAALAHLAGASRTDGARAEGHITELLAGPLADDPALRLEIAVVIGALPAPEARVHLNRLLLDPDPRVARAAGASAARHGDRATVRALLARLADPRQRAAARAALLGMGPAIVAELAGALEDEALPAAVRKRVPGLLAAAGTPAAAEALLRLLRCRDTRLRSRVVRALWRLRRTADAGPAATPIDPGALGRAIEAEVRTYASHLAALDRESAAADPLDGAGPGGAAAAGPGARLLRRALAEKLEDDLERLFRLLGLRYPERDVLAAYYGLRRDEASVRASALELLDNLLEHPLKLTLLGLLEARLAGGGASGRPPVRGAAAAARTKTLAALAVDPDPWLRACALYAIHEAGLSGLAALLDAAASDDDPRVRQVAALARRAAPRRAPLTDTGVHAHDP